MLPLEDIYRTYHLGPRAIIELFEQHLGSAYLHRPPTPSMLEKTIQGQTERIEQLERQVDRLQEQVRQQQDQILQLQRRVAELEERQAAPAKDSHNSHRPPSTDLPTRKRTHSLRQPSGRKPGGQAGHAGHTLPLTDHPDEVITYSPAQCRYCQAPLATGQVVRREHRSRNGSPRDSGFLQSGARGVMPAHTMDAAAGRRRSRADIEALNRGRVRVERGDGPRE